jgi:glycosyltransferase EpsF
MTLRVLHVGGTLGMGGGETWLLELLRHWGRTGAVQMDILLTSGVRGIFDDEAARLGAGLHYLAYTRANLGHFVREYRRLLKVGGYHAVHDHSDYATGWRYLLAIGALPPVLVTHVHNPRLHIDANYAISPSRKAATVVGSWLVRGLATHVCGTSTRLLLEYGFTPGTGRPIVSTVHCGIDVSKFNAPRDADRASVLEEFGWPSDARIVLFAGRLDRAVSFDHPQNHKNSWFALNVAERAARKDPSIRLLMAGNRSESADELERRIEAWGLADRFKLIGVRHDVPRLMRASRALLFPSRQEGLGMVAVEAQAVGLPVLASRAVPYEAMVIPSLYRALDLDTQIEQWADALIEEASRPDAALMECRMALEASPFSIATSARKLECIYSGG